jgi:hypothetical protein
MELQFLCCCHLVHLYRPGAVSLVSCQTSAHQDIKEVKLLYKIRYCMAKINSAKYITYTALYLLNR